MSELDARIRQEPMPDAMHFLLNDYPREAWDSHPEFRQATRNWLGAHRMFRQLASINRTQTEDFLDGRMSADAYRMQLAYYGSALVNNLHGHHHWEDSAYFPELSAADARFDAGRQVLDRDHRVLDDVLDEFTQTANQLTQSLSADTATARTHAGQLHDGAEVISALLDRHLTDEEELAVPIILHYKLRS